MEPGEIYSADGDPACQTPTAGRSLRSGDDRICLAVNRRRAGGDSLPVGENALSVGEDRFQPKRILFRWETILSPWEARTSQAVTIESRIQRVLSPWETILFRWEALLSQVPSIDAGPSGFSPDRRRFSPAGRSLSPLRRS